MLIFSKIVPKLDLDVPEDALLQSSSSDGLLPISCNDPQPRLPMHIL